MVTVISGIRSLSQESEGLVELETLEELFVADEIRLGGALGTDTVATAVLCGEEARIQVYVPFELKDQPRQAVQVIKDCADEVIELHLPWRSKGAFLERNAEMLRGADQLLAFTDGRTTGGTAWTIRHAASLGLPISIVPVGSNESASGGFGSFSAAEPDFPTNVYGILKYHSAKKGFDRASDIVRRLKKPGPNVSTADLLWLAEIVAAYIKSEPELDEAEAIVSMPRRTPGLESGLASLTQVVAGLTDKEYILDWLVREAAPADGVVRAFRERNTADQHFDSLRLRYHVALESVVILDDFAKFGGTMGGALNRVLKDSEVSPIGLVVFGPN